jgi:hypothetical protein
MTNTDVITQDIADSEFFRFIEANQLDCEPSTMNPEELADFNKLKRTITRRMLNGHLVVDEDGGIIFTPAQSKDVNPITFKEPKGSAMLAMDRKNKSEDVGKMYGAMGDIARVPAKTFAVMHANDVKVCLAVTTLFLA